MSPRVARWATTVVLVAIVGAACSSPGDPGVGSEPAPVTLPAPPANDLPTETETDPNSQQLAPEANVELVEAECFGTAVRCGQIHVPQVAGSPDQVSLHFEEFGAPGDRPPVVVLNSSRYPSLPDPGALADRHVFEIATRGVWPAQPVPTCDEWWNLETEAPDAALRAATESCLARLENAGIDLMGNSRENRAADVAHALDALGVSGPVDMIAVGGRADVVAALPASVEVQRVVYVQPWFSGSDPTIARVRDLVASVDAVWEACEESTDCALLGTVGEFWTDIAALDDAPLDRPPSELDEPARPIDSGNLIAAMSSASYTAVEAVYFPAVHAAIRNRDAQALDAFLQNSRGSTELAGYEIACARSTARPDDFSTFPDPVRRNAIKTLESFRTLCDVLQSGGHETRIDPRPGLSILTLSDSWRSAPPDVIIEPTVGAPTTECILSAAVAYFDGEVRGDGCARRLSFTSRGTEIQLAPADVELGDYVATISAPAGWGNGEYGYWERNADLTDSAALDLYVWAADGPTAALDEMIIDWGFDSPDAAPSKSERLAGDRMVRIATNVNPWNESTTVIAVALVDGENLAAVLDGPTAEIESLIGSILIPLFADAVVEPIES